MLLGRTLGEIEGRLDGLELGYVSEGFMDGILELMFVSFISISSSITRIKKIQNQKML